MGMPKPMPPIAQREPVTSLLTAAYPLPPEFRSYETWKSGIAARNLVNVSASAEPVDCRPEGDLYDPDQAGQYVFKPLLTYLPHGCDDGPTGDEDEWRAEAAALARISAPWHMARDLWTGGVTGNPSLQSSAVTSSSAGDLTPMGGVAAVLADYDECSQGKQAFIHAPSCLEPAFTEANLFRTVGGRHVTASGHVIVFGPGYPAGAGDWGPWTDPEDPDSAQSSTASQAWIFASPPVEAAGPHVIRFQDQESEFWEVRKNRFLAIAQVASVVRFDNRCVFGALVTIPG